MRESKDRRLAIYFDRLHRAPAAATFEQALEMACRILDDVEDEYSGDPNEPDNWANLGRMFPPQADNIVPAPGRNGVRVARTKGHIILIGSNGSLEFWRLGRDFRIRTGMMEFRKAGLDGKGLPR